jgi:ATP-binding cassette subfamily B protein
MKTEKKRFMGWQRAIINYFWPFLQNDKPYLILLGAISLVTIASNTLLIWMIGKVVTLITSGNFEPLNETLFIVAGIVLFNMTIQFFYTYTFQRTSLKFVDRVRGELLSQIMRLSYPINFKFQKGDLIARLSGDVDRILTFVFSVPLNLVTSFVVLSVYSTMIFWINWQLALLAIAMAPLFFLSQYFIGPKTGRAATRFTQENAKLMSLEEQLLSNLRGISSFNNEHTMREKHRSQFDIARAWALKVRIIQLLYNSIFTVLIYFVAVIIIFNGISSIQSGQLEVGVFLSFLLYIRFLTNPVRSLAQMPIQMQTSRVSANRVMEILNLRPESELTSGNLANEKILSITAGKISFQDVTFTYPSTSKPVFTQLTTTINPGESIALVGASGSGKSTFAGLLLRFFNPQHGSISIDDIDIKSVSVASLRDQVSIVWQEPLIINGSINDNLLLAKPDATREQMISACQSAYAWEFIEKLDHGLDTLIGPNGTNLSVGQLQRISIAQTFLRDTPILVLDEASSALDSYSEKMVVEALNSLRKNRTTLVIAHRFSSIRNADRVLYFNGDGKISSGSHDELMQQHEEYKNAVDWQITQSPHPS